MKFMAIKYGVLVGKVVGSDREDGDPKSPHYQIFVVGGEQTYRVPVNVQSQNDSELLFYVDNDFSNEEMIQRLTMLGDGFHLLKSKEEGLAVDYIRSRYFEREQMQALSASVAGQDNELQELINRYVTKAKEEREDGSEIYVFGSPFPGGLHDIHMNQGNSGQWRTDNGTWQDGALIFYFALDRVYKAIFLAFQTQSWNTDIKGNPKRREK
jgi:uncharacterized protein YukJ